MDKENSRISLFEKISENKWTEYQGGKKFSDFTEISFQYPEVILEKEDGVFFKLTERNGFWGLNRKYVTNHFYDGYSVDSPQIETHANQNTSQHIIQQQFLNGNGRDHTGIKWEKSIQETHYYEKISENKWTECLGGKIFADFTEISFQYPVVVLKRQDDLYVKLTESEGYWGNNPNNVSSHLSNGKWVKNSPQQDPSQVSPVLNQTNNNNDKVAQE